MINNVTTILFSRDIYEEESSIIQLYIWQWKHF